MAESVPREPTRPSTAAYFQVLTAPGPAAISSIRIIGPSVSTFVGKHLQINGTRPPRQGQGDLQRATLHDTDGAAIDDVLLSWHSDGEPDLRVHLHGSVWLTQRCIELLRALGFTAMPDADDSVAPLWPGCTQVQREAFGLLPAMTTPVGVQWLLSQCAQLPSALDREPAPSSDELRQIAGRFRLVDWFRRSASVLLAGPPNAGKSTLMNALVHDSVSLVSPTPGTTRDWVEAPGVVRGFPVTWTDTAGVRPTLAADGLEAEGIRRTREQIAESDATIVVLDAARDARDDRVRFVDEYADLAPAAVALNKSDLVAPTIADATGILTAALNELPAAWRPCAVPISARQRSGLEALCDRLLEGMGRHTTELAAPAVFTVRQQRLLMTWAESGRIDMAAL